MKSLGEALYETFAAREWTQEERDSIEDVLDAAAAFVAFELPLEEAVKAGVMASREGPAGGAAFARVRAILAAHPRDPRRKALMELFGVLIGAQPGVLTNKGWFTHDDLRGTEIVVKSRRAA